MCLDGLLRTMRAYCKLQNCMHYQYCEYCMHYQYRIHELRSFVLEAEYNVDLAGSMYNDHLFNRLASLDGG